MKGAFCSRCGQAASTERLRFPHLARDFWSGLLALDSKAARTLHALVTHPGAFVRAYLQGCRVTYLDPLRYYLLAIVLNLASSIVLGQAAVSPVRHDLGSSIWERNFMAFQVSMVFVVLMIPLAGVQRLLYRNTGDTVAEHFAFLLYVLAQSILAILVLKLALLLPGITLDGAAEGLAWLGAFSAYWLWASRGFWGGPFWKSATRLLSAYAVAGLCIGLMRFVIAALLN